MKKHLPIKAAALLGSIVLAGSVLAQSQTTPPTKRTIYMSAVEYKGGTSVEKEPFPSATPPSGGGYILKAPEGGRWENSTYRFEPGLIVANQGDEVELKIWGVNGAKHTTTIEGYEKAFVVKRGELTTITFKADKPGIFRIICHDHLPSMETQLLVLASQAKR